MVKKSKRRVPVKGGSKRIKNKGISKLLVGGKLAGDPGEKAINDFHEFMNRIRSGKLEDNDGNNDGNYDKIVEYFRLLGGSESAILVRRPFSTKPPTESALDGAADGTADAVQPASGSPAAETADARYDEFIKKLLGATTKPEAPLEPEDGKNYLVGPANVLYKIELGEKLRGAQDEYNDKAIIKLFRLDQSSPKILESFEQDNAITKQGSIINLIDEYRMPALSSLLKTALSLKGSDGSGKYKPEDFVGRISEPVSDAAMTRNEKAVKYGRFINATGIPLDANHMLDRDTVKGEKKVVENMFPDAKVVFV